MGPAVFHVLLLHKGTPHTLQGHQYPAVTTVPLSLNFINPLDVVLTKSNTLHVRAVYAIHVKYTIYILLLYIQI